MSKCPCPECGSSMDRRSKRCAGCSGYGRKRNVMSSGYVRVWDPDHPLAMRDGYVLEHRKVVHDAGIDVPAGHQVHHVNGNKTDNRLDNLEVISESDHHRHHAQEAGFVTNQFGVWPVLTEDERREKHRERMKAWHAANPRRKAS